MALGDLQEEPSAGKPHARICEGENRMAELLDQAQALRRLLVVRATAFQVLVGLAVRMRVDGGVTVWGCNEIDTWIVRGVSCDSRADLKKHHRRAATILKAVSALLVGWEAR